MARPKLEERQRARALREAGLSLRQIAAELDVALSSVSVWVREVEILTTARTDRDPGDAPEPAPAQLSGDTKRCGRCNLVLPIESFNRHRAGRQWWCRDCFRAYFRARGNQHRVQSKVARRARQDRGLAYLRAFLEASRCVDCGIDDWRVLEPDHLAGKTANVSDMVRRGASVRKLSAELERCEIVCCNCHRIRTARAHGSWRLDPDSIRIRGFDRARRRNLEWIAAVLERSHCTDCGSQDILCLEFDQSGRSGWR